jgi:hypothetical protein
VIAVAAETTVKTEDTAEQQKREIKIVTGVYEERPIRPMRRVLDIPIGGALMLMPVFGLGAYIFFMLPVSGFGLVYIVVQWLLNRKEPGRKRLIVSMVIRVLAVIVIAAAIALLTDAGNSKKSLYKAKLTLYMMGNYGKKIKELDFIPDTLPESCKGFRMELVSKKWGSKEYGSVRIRFIADKEGREELKQTALKEGGEECFEGDFIYTKLEAYCDSIGQKMSGAEVFAVGEQKKHSPSFLINSRTGLCVIFW